MVWFLAGVVCGVFITIGVIVTVGAFLSQSVTEHRTFPYVPPRDAA